MRISHYGGMDSSVGIIEAIKKDRTAGAVRLVAEYKDRLYGAALGLCENASEAEDLVFRTFEQVIAKIDTYREDEAFFAWMYTILRNYHRMSLRGNVAKNTFPAGGLHDLEEVSGTDGADSVVAAIDGNILRKAVDALPPEMREVVVLHYFMDQPVGKIAKILSIAKGTVKSRLYYARLALGLRLGATLKKSATAMIAAGFFMAAAFAVTFTVSEPPQLAEVDEPVYLHDEPLPFDEGFQDDGDLVTRVAGSQPEAAGEGDCASPAAIPFTPPVARAKTSAAKSLSGFCSCSRAVRSKRLPSFNSTAAYQVVIAFR